MVELSGTIVALFSLVVGIALFFAPLFIWHRCSQILEVQRFAFRRTEEQREKIIKLLTFIANELTKR